MVMVITSMVMKTKGASTERQTQGSCSQGKNIRVVQGLFKPPLGICQRKVWAWEGFLQGCLGSQVAELEGRATLPGLGQRRDGIR